MSIDLNVFLRFSKVPSHLIFDGSFNLPLVKFILSHSDSNLYSGDKELLEEIEANVGITM